MGWGLASKGRQCNRCRVELAEFARVWRGNHTPAVWCEPCAGEAGLDGEAAVDVRGREMAAMEAGLAAALDRLKALAARRGPRDVSARMIGDRDDGERI